VDIIYYY